MKRNPHKKYKTIGYVRILDDSRKESVKMDLGERVAVWFPRAAIEIDNRDFSITGEESFINQKLGHAEGKQETRNPPKMIALAAPDWNGDKSIGIDVQVFRDGCTDSTETRVFINKSMIENGCAPLWLVKRTESKAIKKVADDKYPEEEYFVNGLRARDEPRKRSGGNSHYSRSSRRISFKR